MRGGVVAAVLVLLASGVALPASFGAAGGQTFRLGIFGDSISAGGQPDGCPWCDPFTALGVRIMNTAVFGSKSYDKPSDGKCDPPGYTACDVANQIAGERVALYAGGACRSDLPKWTGDASGSSCLVDRPTTSQDVDVYFFGVNDVDFWTVSEWSTTYMQESLDAFSAMMDLSASLGHACVVVLGPPGFNAFQSDPLDTDVKLVALHDALRPLVAARPTCAVADVYSAFRAVESRYGLQAMLDMYADVGCTTSPPGCVHPADGPTPLGFRPNDMVGGIILRAALAARDSLNASTASGLPLALPFTLE